MKITAVETIHVRIPFTCGGPTPSFSGQPWKTIDTLLVKVGTDTGIVGWGEAFGHAVIPATRVAVDTLIAPLCIGRDPTQIDALMFDLHQQMHLLGRNGPVMFGLSGLDIALWDIAGKRAGLPIYELLGGSAKRDLPAYASLIRYTEPEIVARNAARAVSQGYRYVKLHEIGVDQTRAARAAVGQDVSLMLDTNCPWSLRDATEMALQLEQFDLYWLEEPCWPPENYTALAELRASTTIPLAAGENNNTAMGFAQMIDAGAVDFVQPSPAKVGGISEARRVIALADSCNVSVAPHTPYFGPGLVAGMHLNAARTAETLFEWLYVDLETTLYGDAILPVQGRVALPRGPGLGYDPDPAVIAKYGS